MAQTRLENLVSESNFGTKHEMLTPWTDLEMPYVQPVKPLEDIVPSSTRRKFEKPSRLPGHLPVQHVPSKDKAASASVVEGAVPPARKRKAWMPFGHSKATAVAAH